MASSHPAVSDDGRYVVFKAGWTYGNSAVPGALGTLGQEIAKGASKAGLADEAIIWAKSHDEIVDLLAAEIKPGDWILVKGSRGMAMEQVVNGLHTRLAKTDGKGV